MCLEATLIVAGEGFLVVLQVVRGDLGEGLEGRSTLGEALERWPKIDGDGGFKVLNHSESIQQREMKRGSTIETAG